MSLPDGVVPAPAPEAPRCTVRHRLADGSATDVVGSVTRDDAAGLTVLPDDRGPLEIRRADVIALRRVPPRRVRPASSPGDLERLAARGWPGLEQARLGGWLLRAGGGWTGRANSTLVVGDPGLPLDVALERVASFYRARALPPRLHVPWSLGEHTSGRYHPSGLGDDIDAAAGRAGWIAYDETLVLTADIRRLALGATSSSAADLSWSPRPDDAWLRVLRGGASRADPAAVRVLGSVPAHYLSVTIDAVVAAVGRVVVTDDWCGIAAIEVAPPWRRAGLGRLVATELLRRGRDSTARFAYLQTLQSNSGALALYDSLGFGVHHGYHYRRLDEA